MRLARNCRNSYHLLQFCCFVLKSHTEVTCIVIIQLYCFLTRDSSSSGSGKSGRKFPDGSGWKASEFSGSGRDLCMNFAREKKWNWWYISEHNDAEFENNIIFRSGNLFIFNFFFHQKGRNGQCKRCIFIGISCNY